MHFAVRPQMDGMVPMLELELGNADDLVIFRANLDQAAEMIASLRVSIQRSMSLHQLLADRSTPPVFMLAAEGTA